MKNATRGMLVGLVALGVNACGGDAQVGVGATPEGAAPDSAPDSASDLSPTGGGTDADSVEGDSASARHHVHQQAIRDAIGDEYAERILEFGDAREVYTLETHDGRTVTWYESGYGHLTVVEEATGAMRLPQLNPDARPTEVFSFYQPGESMPVELTRFDQRIAEVAPVYAEIERLRAELFPETLVSVAQPEGVALEVEQPATDVGGAQFATVGSAITVSEFEGRCEGLVFRDRGKLAIQTDRGATAKIKKEDVDLIEARATSHEGTIQWQYKKRLWWESYKEIWKRDIKENKSSSLLDHESYVDFDAEIAIYPGSGERASQCMVYID